LYNNLYNKIHNKSTTNREVAQFSVTALFSDCTVLLDVI